MLSITLTLFGGLGLKATTEIPSEDPTVYEQGLMAFILTAINVGVVLLAAYQIFLTFRQPPKMNQVKLQRKVCVKIFDAALANNTASVDEACRLISPEHPERLSPVLTQGLRELARLLPIALDTLTDLDKILGELSEMSSLGDAMDVLDKCMKLAAKILGKPRTKALFAPYCKVVSDQVTDHLAALGAPPELLDQFGAMLPGLCQHLVGNGLKSFVNDMMKLTEVNNLDSLSAAMRGLAEDIREENEEGGT